MFLVYLVEVGDDTVSIANLAKRAISLAYP